MNDASLQQVLDDFRRFRTDHQAVEAKRAGGGLPETAWESLSAFANSNGGLLLLGVDEGAGAFEITGVDDPERMIQALQAACAELEPPLRPAIDLIEHEQKVVIAAEVAGIPRNQRPCHRRGLGPHHSSFIRVGDADQKLSEGEVTELLASQSLHDHSLRPAPSGSTLSDDIVESFLQRLRDAYDRHVDRSDDELLETYGAAQDGAPTIAGLLAMGKEPASRSAAARIAYRLLPTGRERYAASHLEGTVGELLDDALNRLARDLRTVQVERSGRLYDDLEVPAIALREVLGNALLHRSLTSTQENASISVEVSEEAVEITSPGGLHVAADIAELGLAPLSSLRNLTLVRICEQLRTPRDDRIVENQASGIKAADEACREADVMPPLFVDRPASFRVVLLRKALDLRAAQEQLAETSLAGNQEAARLLAVAVRLKDVAEGTPGSHVREIHLDAGLAARALAPRRPEDAASLLSRIEADGLLVRRHASMLPEWLIPPERAAAKTSVPSSGRQSKRKRPARRERLDQLVRAIDQSEEGELGSADLGAAIGASSTRTASKWINEAIDDDLLEPTTESSYDPARAYRLTDRGRGRARALEKSDD